MDLELYRAAQEGNINALRLQSQHFSTQLTPNKNTPLHVVALFNDSQECIEEILNANESLMFEVNSDGDSALHIAARNGKLDVGSTMITRAKHSDQEVESGGGKLESLLSMRNNNGNTPLHEAIMSNQSEMVAIMLEDYPEIANIANNSSETPLFLAIYKKRTLCRRFIMEYCPSPAYTGPERRTALHAAAATLNSRGFTQVLLNKHPTLIKMVDNSGWTALHYAARYGSDNVVKELLETDKSVAYVVAEGDDNKTALHLATCKGDVEIMREILLYCPDCWEMVTGDGRNILHLAVKFEKEKALRFILKQSWVGNLINQQDAEGNTPLRIYAATNSLEGADLVNHLQADRNVVNKKQMTPLDVVVHSDIFSARQDDIEKELKIKAAVMGIWNPLNRDNRSQEMKAYEERKRDIPMDLRKFGDTQMVVAALMMSITFAAGFTIPGGYKENDGHAILSKNALFMIFVIADTLAVVLSASALSLYMVAAMFSSRQSIIQRYYTATILIKVAMCCTIFAFMFGFLVLIEEVVPLALIQFIICIIWVRFFVHTIQVTRKSIGSWKNL